MTPREPDRFEAQAREILREAHANPAQVMWLLPYVMDGLRAAESSALERAAQLCDSRAANMDGKESLEIATLQLRGASEGIRALIPPAAAQRDRDWDVLKTALAAARRECDLLRAAIDRAVSAFMSGGVCDFCRNNKEKGYHEEDCDLGALIAEAAVAANVARFNTALAAPAAGEEGKR